MMTGGYDRLLLAVMAAFLFSTHIQAACPCARSAMTGQWAGTSHFGAMGGYGATDGYGTSLSPIPQSDWNSSQLPETARLVSPQAQAFAGTQAPLVDRFGMSPPPGTLGRTYRVRTRLIEDDLHPRVGILEVHLPENANITARGLKNTWTGKVWELKSADPLLPGIPQVYAVKAEFDRDGQRVTEYRWVRLIMGRVVELDF